MTDHEAYYQYLKKRRLLSLLYRRAHLYPRICRHFSGRVLDVGCGIGDMLSHRPNTVGVDVNPLLVEHCRKRGVEAYLAQRDLLPFDDQAFDGVLMDNVLEHILEPTTILSEISRVLVPHGRLIVGVPGQKGYERDSDHKVFYSEESLVRLLATSGYALHEMFFVPFRSSYLDRALAQYCVYGVFRWIRARSARGPTPGTETSTTLFPPLTTSIN